MSTRLSTDVIAILQSLSDAMLVVDAEGRIVFANDRSEAVFGYQPAELTGRYVEDLLPGAPRDCDEACRLREQAGFDGRRKGRAPTQIAVRADGTEVPVAVAIDLIGGAGSSLLLTSVRDTSDVFRLLDAAEKAEERYRMVVDTASEVFYRVRMDHDTLRGIVEFVSPQCYKLTAYRPEDFLANPGLWIECIHPDDRQVLFHTTDEILRNGVEASRYYRIRNRASGEFRWVADRVVPLHDETGRPTGYQGVARDITERRRADEERQHLEDELRQAQKMEAIGRLAGGVAHDFNNLVTVILASCDAARSTLDAASPVDANLAEISDAGHRAVELTRKLLTLSHDHPSSMRMIDLNAHLVASRALIRRLLPERIELRWSLAESLWPVRLDGSQLDQVVFNLAANARDAMPDGGVLSIATRNVTCSDEVFLTAGGLLPGDYVQLALTDTGVGMDAATVAHMFEPFYTTKLEGQGTGLGLASVYGIVKQHRGDIHVESTLGEGTRVVIHFPRCRATGDA